MITPRVFTRLSLAYNGISIHPFFLERMANVQWSNEPPFVRGPFIHTQKQKEEYGYWNVVESIEYSLRHFMKPHQIEVFGCDVLDISKPFLLTRVWLNATPSENRAFVLTERITTVHPLLLNPYWVAINNDSWRPTEWEQIQKAKSITQTLSSTQQKQNTKWHVKMKMQ